MTIDVIPAGRAGFRPPSQQEARTGSVASFGQLTPQTEPTRQLATPATPADPNVGRAALNIASTFSSINETVQNIGGAIWEKEEKERKGLARTKALEGFQAYQGNLQREMVTMQSELSGTAAEGYTARVAARLDEAGKAFLDTIEDEDLRQEFSERIANVNESFHTQAFKDEIVSRRSYVKDSIGRVLDNGLAEIRADKGGADRTLAIAIEMIDNSGLPEDQKEALRHNVRLKVQEANLASEARIKAAADAAATKRRKEQLGDFTAAARNGAIVGQGRVTAWDTAPTVVQRTLMAIADTESPGYNVMYTPRGEEWRTFDDFSVHPNKPAIINSGPNAGKNSTAAGKYQFLYSTWNWINSQLPDGPLPDFSPESQDKAAWWLAEYIYREETGRDLQVDLLTPTPEVLAQLRAALGKRWEGTLKQSDEDFAAAWMAGIEEMDGRDLLSTPGYEDLTFEQKLAIITDQELKAQASITAAEVKREEIRANNAAKLLKGFNEGTVSFQEIMDAAEAEALNAKELEIAKEIYAERQKKVQEQNELKDKLADESYVFRDDAAGRKAYAQVLDPKAVTDLLAGNVQTLVQNLPVVARFSEVDQSAIFNAASKVSNSTTYDKMAAGFSAFSLMEQTLGEDRFAKQVGKTDLARYEVWKKLNGLLTPEELVARFNPMDANAAELKEKRREQVAKELTKDPSLLNMETVFDTFDTFAGLATEIGNELPLTDTLFGLEDQPIAPLYSERNAQLIGEYQTLTIEMYAENGGDLEAAQEAAAKLLTRTWAVTEFDGKRRLAKWPIETTNYPRYQGGYGWVAEQIRAELALPETTGVYIIGDGITAMEDAKNKRDGGAALPSYLVLVEQADGTYDFPSDAKGLPQRMTFNYGELEALSKLDYRRERLAKQWGEARREAAKDVTNEALRERVQALEEELRLTDERRVYVKEQWLKGVRDGQD